MFEFNKALHVLAGANRKVRTAPRTALTLLACCATFATPTVAAADGEIAIEINKLEDKQGSCRTYVLVNNSSQTAYSSLTLDLVMFRTDGIMDRRLALKLAPIRKEKRSLKLFDLKGVACNQVGNFLLNDVMECATKDGPVENCLSKLSVSSRADAKLTK